jgi:hypothetical protein
MSIQEIKKHPFFYGTPLSPWSALVLTCHSLPPGVDWVTLRSIDAPFVPHLRFFLKKKSSSAHISDGFSRSLTDTSYFPVNELEQAPEDAPAVAGDAAKDLAFLGFVQNLSVVIMLTCTTDTLSNASRYHLMPFRGLFSCSI